MLSGESSSDVEDDELLLTSFAARFPFKRLGLYGLKMVRKGNQIFELFYLNSGPLIKTLIFNTLPWWTLSIIKI